MILYRFNLFFLIIILLDYISYNYINHLPNIITNNFNDNFPKNIIQLLKFN